MTKGFKKKLSKRMPAKRRYKIEKKVKEHNRKLRRSAKKNPKRVKAKDPGIPNSVPFKEDIIQEAMLVKQNEEERKKLVREENKKRQKDAREKKLNQGRNIDLESLAKSADDRTKQFEKSEKAKPDADSNQLSNLRAFSKEFHKVVEAADVIIEVLDARDPLGTRCPEVEDAVAQSGPKKRLVLLLNKVDLIPKENMKNWLTYLRNELPTVAFKASTQTQKNNIGRLSGDIETANEAMLSSSKCLGASNLMKLLGNYCRNKDVKTNITVGIVGFPNVGKSSVINSLKRSKSCNVGSIAGVTRKKQEVTLDKHIKLLDCPGIVFAKSSGERGENSSALLELRNAVRVDQVNDTVTPVKAILARVKKEDLMLFYRLPDFQSVEEFLALMAKRFGKLKKGGVPDIFGASKKVLTDWNAGKIKYYTVPPEKYSMSAHFSATIVNELSEGFDLDKAFQDEEMELFDKEIADKVTGASAFAIPSGGLTSGGDAQMQAVAGSESEDVEMTDAGASESRPRTKIQLKTKSKSKKGNTTREDVEVHEEALQGMQLNKAKKVHFKKMQKLKKRQNKLSEKLAVNFDGNVKLSDDYDFDANFK